MVVRPPPSPLPPGTLETLGLGFGVRRHDQRPVSQDEISSREVPRGYKVSSSLFILLNGEHCTVLCHLGNYTIYYLVSTLHSHSALLSIDNNKHSQLFCFLLADTDCLACDQVMCVVIQQVCSLYIYLQILRGFLCKYSLHNKMKRVTVGVRR